MTDFSRLEQGDARRLEAAVARHREGQRRYARPSQRDLEGLTRTIGEAQRGVVHLVIKGRPSFLGYVGGFFEEASQAVRGFPNPWEIVDIPLHALFGWVRQFFKYATGSAFIFSEDGYLLTSAHLVREASEIRVFGLAEGQAFVSARVVYVDPLVDFAILRVDPDGALYLPALPMGLANESRIGQLAIVLGYPFRGPEAGGYRNPTATLGLVSSVDVQLFGGGDSNTGYIQTDAAINPGNSGGPLLDIEGRVLGISTFVVRGAENIGFALPSEWVLEQIERAIRHSAGSDEQNRAAQAAFEEGFWAYRAGRMRDAVTAYAAAAEARSDAGVAHFMVGVCSYLVGDLRVARDALDRARQLSYHPEYLALWRQVVLRRLGNTAEADAEAGDYLRGLPIATWPHPILAFLSGRLTESQLRRAATATGDSRTVVRRMEAEFFMAQADIRAGRIDRARERLTSLDPTRAPAILEGHAARYLLEHLP